MIFGIGVDTATISRIEKSLLRPGFMQKVYGEDEHKIFNAQKSPAKSAAANFAAKEAFSKSAGTGIFSGTFEMNEVQILREDSGRPYFLFLGKALAYVKANGIKAHVSLTHEGDFATAFVVLEKD